MWYKNNQSINQTCCDLDSRCQEWVLLYRGCHGSLLTMPFCNLTSLTFHSSWWAWLQDSVLKPYLWVSAYFCLYQIWIVVTCLLLGFFFINNVFCGLVIGVCVYLWYISMLKIDKQVDNWFKCQVNHDGYIGVKHILSEHNTC